MTTPRPEPEVPGRRAQAAGWALAVVLPTAVALGLGAGRGGQAGEAASLASLASLAALLLLAATVLVALVGGRWPALASAVTGFLTLNLAFTEPVGHLSVARPRGAAVLVVFLAVALAVASVVDRAARRASEAARARAEAGALAALSRSVLTGQDTAEAVVQRVRDSFGQDAVALVGPAGQVLAAAAPPSEGVPGPDGPDATVVPVDADSVLVLRGRSLAAGERRVVEAFAVQAGLVLEYRRLREREERAAVLEHAEATSTGLLRAVSHDLRTPLATMRAAVDGLGAPGLGDADRRALVEAVAGSTAQLEHLIDDLLDLSRVQSGLVRPVLRPRSLEEVLPPAVAGHPPGAVRLDVEESVPLVSTDAGLLERVVANLVANAVRASAGVAAVQVRAEVGPDAVDVLVVDRGPGVPDAAKPGMFEPFQRLDDTAPGGLGLGLAVARGLTEALGGTLTATDTPGGGLTMVVGVPRARPEAS